MTLKTDAEVLRLGLVLGLIDRSAIVAWADELILADRAAEIPVAFDLSTSATTPLSDVITQLGRVPGEIDPQAIGRRVAGHLRESLTTGRLDITAVARAMQRLLREGLAPDDDFEHMAYHADDGVDLALSGTYGTLPAIHDDVIRFLDRYSAS